MKGDTWSLDYCSYAARKSQSHAIFKDLFLFPVYLDSPPNIEFYVIGVLLRVLEEV